jgi:hypothetical protein
MSILQNRPNSKRQGEIGVAMAVSWFYKNGYRVFMPLGDYPEVDLVVGADGKLFSVQVKTTYHHTEYGVYKALLATNGGNRSGTGKTKYFDPTKVDYVFILTDSEQMYFIPSGCIPARKTINLGEQYEQFRVE